MSQNVYRTSSVFLNRPYYITFDPIRNTSYLTFCSSMAFLNGILDALQVLDIDFFQELAEPGQLFFDFR